MKVLKKAVKNKVDNLVEFPISAKETKEVSLPVSYREMMSREFLNYTKKGEMTITDLFDIAREQDERCFDKVVNFSESRISFEPYYGTKEVFFNSSDESSSGFFSPHSSSQLFMRFGIPNTYARFCVENEGHDLLIENIEHWREKFGGNYLLRYYNMNDGNKPIIRAMLTEKYKAFDTIDIMNVIRRNDDVRKNYSVRNWLMNPERLHIRLVSDNRLNVASDEDLFMGVNLDSSDVGRSSLRLSIIIFKQVCTNGLILPQGISKVYRQIHFGSGADRFEENVEVAMDAVSKMKEVAEEVITKAGTKALPFEIDDEEAVERFRIGHKLSKEAMQMIIAGLKAETYGKPSVWSLINVMTEVAQNYTIDARIDMEREAGRLLLVA